jgi:hypothetical protein
MPGRPAELRALPGLHWHASRRNLAENTSSIALHRDAVSAAGADLSAGRSAAPAEAVMGYAENRLSAGFPTAVDP